MSRQHPDPQTRHCARCDTTLAVSSTPSGQALLEAWEAEHDHREPEPTCTCDGPPHRLICATVLG